MKNLTSNLTKPAALTLLVAALFSQNIFAQTLYWETNGATVGAGGTTPSGTWDAGTANWSTSSAGGIATVDWTSGDTAVFSAGTDATGSYTVTLSGTQTAGGVNFQTGSATLSGSTLALTASGVISVNAAPVKGIIASVISGSVGLTKQNSGELVLAGANIFSGNLTNQSGTLTLNNSSAASSGSIILNPGIGSTVTLTSSNAAITIGNNLILGGNSAGTTQIVPLTNNTLTLTGVVSGSHNWSVNGPGTLVLSGSVVNTNSGAFTVQQGTVVVTADGALGTIGNGTLVNAGATLALSGGFSYLTDEPVTLNGSGVGNNGAFQGLTGENYFGGAITLGSDTTMGAQAGGELIVGTPVNSTGTANLTITNAGTVALGGLDNIYSNTLVAAGTLEADYPANAGNGLVTVNAGASLTGSGSAPGGVKLSGTIAPNGEFSSGAETWNGGGGYVWEIADAINPLANDLLDISSGLTNTATSGSFTISVVSLNPNTDLPGTPGNFDNTQQYDWIIASTTTGIVGFASADFTINATQFLPSLGGGSFRLLVSNSTNLVLEFDPAPVINCPNPIAQDNDPNDCSATVSFAAIATNYPDLSPVTISYQTNGVTIASPCVFPKGTTVVNATATDAVGDTAQCSFTVTVNDTQAPTVLTKNITLPLDEAGNGSITPSQVDHGSYDNCAITNLSVSPNSFTTANVGPNTVTLTATDSSGNQASATAVVTVVYAYPPGLTCVPDVTVTVKQDREPYATGYPTATDPDGPVIFTYSDDVSGLTNCDVTGMILRTWTATDASSNVSTCVQTITVIDTNTPYFTYVPADITTTNDWGLCSAVVGYTPAAVDLGYFQGFENPNWVDNTNSGNGDWDWNDYESHIYRAASGTDGIVSPNGVAYAVIDSTVPAAGPDYANSGVYTLFGGGTIPFASGYRVALDVYINFTDPEVASSTPTSGYGFDLDTDPQAFPNGGYGGQDFVFHVAAYSPTGIVVAADNGSSDTGTERPTGLLTYPNYGMLTNSGWYTFEWNFRETNGFLAVDMNVRDTNRAVQFSQTLVDYSWAPDAITNIAGNPNYLWFNFIDDDKLPVANAVYQRIIPVDSSPVSPMAFPVGTTTVTSTATDECGNSTNTTFTVTVNDVEPPVILPLANLVQNNDPGLCGAVVTYPTLTATDNCMVASVVATPASGSTFDVGTSTVTVVATDIHGNAATNTFTVTVNDTEPPSANVPANIVQANDPGVCSAVVNFTLLTQTDNCGVLGQVATPASGSSFPVGTTSVTVIVTDIHGNTATNTFTVTVNDTEPPSANVPANIVQANDPGVCGAVVNFTLPTQTDNCGVLGQVATPASGSSFPKGTTTVTVVVTDIHGNTATNTFTVTVNDTQAPTVLTKNITLPLDEAGNGSITPSQVDHGSYDNCAITNLSVSPNSFTTANVGPNTVTLTATDSSGNQASATAVVTVVYAYPPGLTCVPDVTVTVKQDREPYATGYPTATDPDGPVIFTYSDDVSGLTNCDVTGMILRTWTATDASSNVSTCVQTITVIDTNTPYFTYVPADITTTNDWGLCSAVVGYTPAAVDLGYFQGFENPNWVDNTNSGNGDWDWNDYESHIYRAASGTDGIVSPNGVAYAVIDSTVPAAGPDYANSGVYTLFGGGTIPFASGYRVALDVYINFTDPEVASSTPTSGYGFDLDTDPQAFPNGGYGGQDFVFHVAAYSPTGIVVAADNGSSDTGTERPTGLLTYPNYGMLTNSGWYTFEWNFRETNGFLAVDMNVRDTNRAVQFSQTLVDYSWAPDAITNIAGNPNYLWFNFIDDDKLPVANAVYQRIIPVDSSPVSPMAFPVGTTTVTSTATDECGNSTNTTFTVTVNDVEPPVILPLANLVQNNDPGLCGAVVTYPTLTATDNCMVASVVATPASGSTFDVGTSTVTVVATDIHGNAATNTFTVTVNDTEPPSANVPANIVQANDPGVCSAVVNFTLLTQTDNCGVLGQVATPASGSSFPVGTTSVTVIVTDIHGNTATNTFTVTVNDTEPPSANVPANIVQANDPGVCGAVVNFTLPTQTDNCGVLGQVATPASGSSFPKGTTTVTVVVTDIHGNTATNTFTVTVNDTQAPTVLTKNITLPLDEAGNGSITPSQVDHGSYDNCAITNLSVSPNSFTTANVGPNTVTLTATDSSGNQASATAVVTVVYAYPPGLTCVPDVTVTVKQDREPYATGYPTATDPDGPVIFTYSDDVSGLTNCDVTGMILRTWTATDASSNVSTCVQTITVIDTNTPYFTYVPADITTTNDWGLCSAVVGYTPAAVDLGYFQGFENPNWVDNTNSGNGDWDWNDYESHIYRAASGTDGIVSPNGVAYAVIDSTVPAAGPDYANSGVYTLFGGGTIPFASGYRVALDVYINFTDPEVASSTPTSGYGFDLDTDPQAFPNGGYGGQDFVFHVAAYSPTGIVVAADNGSSDTGTERPTGLLTYPNYGMLTNSGWYTFEWNFRETNGFLAVDMNVRDTNRAVQFSQTLVDYSWAPDAITNIAGNPNYLWFNFIDDDKLPVANAVYQRIIPVDSSPVSPMAFPVGTTTVTSTATDECGNSTNTTFTVTVNDVEPPVILPLANLVQNNDPGLCGAVVTYPTLTATDNCMVASVVATPASGSTFDVGTSTVTVVATDIHGNAATNTFTVTVNDTEPPSANVPANIVQANDPGVCSAVVNFTLLTQTDNCGVLGQVATPASGSSFPVGTTSVTVIVTDIHGNTATNTFTVTVNDTEPPSANVPANIVQANDPGVCGAVVNFTLPTQTDNCGVLGQVATPASGSSFPKGTTTVTVVVTDIHGNTATNTFTVTVNDTQAPTVLTKNITLPLDEAGNGSITPSQVDHGSYDNCAITNLSVSPNSFTTANVGPNTVTLTATDSSGNQASATAVVTVVYAYPPGLTCVPDVTVTVKQDREPYATGYPTATDPDGPVIFTYSDDVSGLTNCDVTGMILRTWTATDASSNVSTCVQTITVIDTNTPYFTYVPADITTTNDWGLCSAVVGYTPAAVDLGYFQGFENPNWVDNTNSGNGDWDWNDYESHIYRAASGTDGIVSPNGVAYAVIDSTVPAAGPDYANSGVYTLFGGGTIPFASGYRVALDVYINFTDPEVASSTPTSGYGFDLDTDPQAFPNGGYGGQDFVFHVAAYSPTGIVVAADNGSSDTGTERPTGLLTYPNYGMLTNSGWYTFEWNFRETNGFLAVDMNVRDTNRAVQFSQTLVDYSWAPDAITNIAGNPNYLWFNFIDDDKLPVANAVYQRIIPVDSSPVSPMAFPVGTTTVTSTATDECGNSTNTTFTVTVNDVEPPVILPLANLVQNNDPGLCGAVVTYPTLTATDNCMVASVVATPASGSTFDVGTSTVTVVATDIHGNAATNTFTVTVNDTEPPVILPLANLVQDNDPGSTTAVVRFPTPPATDNCGMPSVVATPASGSTFNAGTTTVTVVATDIHGNTATSTFTVTVIDEPVIISLLPASQTNNATTTATFAVSASGTTPFTYHWTKITPTATNILVDGGNISGSTSNVLTITNVLAADQAEYAVTVSNPAGSAITNGTLVVIDPVIFVQPVSVTNVLGSTVGFSVTAAGTAPLSYQWFQDGFGLPGETGSTLTLADAQDSDEGDYTVVVTNDVGGEAISDIATLTLTHPPVIVTPPASQTVNQGVTVTFTVSVNGRSPFTYQWEKNGVNILSPSATTRTLVLNNVTTADDSNYEVAITNADGGIISAPATLTVIAPPAITSQPAGLTNNAGTTASFSITASGTAPTYQWFKITATSTNALTDGGNVSGSISNVLTLTNVLGADSAYYYLVASNQAGVATSSNAILAVIDPIITSEPVSLTVNLGSPASFSVGAYGTSPHYQWFKGGIAINGANASTYAIASAADSDVAGYTVVVTNIYGTATSAPPATLTVIDPPVITSQPQSRTNNAGTTATFTVGYTGTAPSFQWYKGLTAIGGATTATLTLANVQDVDAASYSVVLTNIIGTVTSSNATLTVIDAPVITGQPQSRTNNAGTTATFTASYNGTAPSFQWYKGVAAIGGATTATLTLANVQDADAASYSVVLTNAAGTVTSSNATLTVIDAPVITGQPQSRTNNAGTTATFTVAYTGTAPGFQWYKGLTGIGGATTATLTLANVADVDAASYSVVLTNAAGTVTSSNATLTVIDAPVIVSILPASQTNNVTTTASFAVSASGTAPFTYQWTKITATATNVLADGGNISGSTNSVLTITDVLGADQAEYAVTVSNPAGSATTNGTLVVLDPAILVQPVGSTNFDGSTVSLSVTAAGTATLNYQWFQDGVPVFGATSSTLTLTDIADDVAGLYTVVVTNSVGSVTSTPALLVTVAPLITTQPVNVYVVQGQPASFSVSVNGQTPFTYQWLLNGTNVTDAIGTNRIYSLSHATNSTDAGRYQVVVSNPIGTQISSNATLAVYATAAPTLAVVSYANHQATVTLVGVPTFNYAIQSSSNLFDWVSLMTNTTPFTFTDTNRFDHQFYRGHYLP